MAPVVRDWTCLERRSKAIVRRFPPPVPVLCFVPTGFLHLESGGMPIESGGMPIESGGMPIESGGNRVEAGSERIEAGGERVEFGATGLTTHGARPKSRASSTIFNSAKPSRVQSPIGFGQPSMNRDCVVLPEIEKTARTPRNARRVDEDRSPSDRLLFPRRLPASWQFHIFENQGQPDGP
jgi:hypothetical protein